MTPTNIALMIVVTLASFWLTSDSSMPPPPPPTAVLATGATGLNNALVVVGYCGVASSLLWATALVTSAWLRYRRRRSP